MLHVPVSWPALLQTYLKVIFILKLVCQFGHSIKKDNSLFVSHTHSDTHTVDNRVRQGEYGSFRVTEGSIFSNCVCHTAT